MQTPMNARNVLLGSIVTAAVVALLLLTAMPALAQYPSTTRRHIRNRGRLPQNTR